MHTKLVKAVEKHTELILAAQDYIWANPETGYREWKTSGYMAEKFRELGYELTMAEDIPGFYTVIDTGREGPEVLVLGELDSLICFDHPDSDKQTGAVHCCGHSAQCAALLGIAAALKEEGALDELSGRIRLCAVPAEELIEIEYRQSLINKGTIKYFGGKPEFLRRGYFDGVDLAFMVHTTSGDIFETTKGGVGCLSKQIIYKGVSAHAGGSPWNGVNALYAATQGLSAINAIRETFKEPDVIRVHPIITKGGNAVNAIPDTVTIESYVRGSTFEAIEKANKKVNRALTGAALSLGANVEIVDKAGYSPIYNSQGMIDMAIDAAALLPEISFEVTDYFSSGSTDMGDLCCVMPIIHPYAAGATGTSHGADYYIANPMLACVGSAKWQVCMLYTLLKDGGARAKKIAEEFEPMFKTKEEFFSYVDSLESTGDRITYKDGTAEVRL